MIRTAPVFVLLSLLMSAVSLTGCDAGHEASNNGSHGNAADRQSASTSEPTVVELTPEELELLLAEFAEVAEKIADEADRYRPGLREVTEGIEGLALTSMRTWQQLLEIGFVPSRQIDDYLHRPAWLEEVPDD